MAADGFGRELLPGGDNVSPSTWTFRYFFGEALDRALLGELGQMGGGVLSAPRAARCLANRVEYRVGYGENWSYPPPWRGAAGTLNADGEGGGGVLAILNIDFDDMRINGIFRLRCRK